MPARCLRSKSGAPARRAFPAPRLEREYIGRRILPPEEAVEPLTARCRRQVRCIIRPVPGDANPVVVTPIARATRTAFASEPVGVGACVLPSDARRDDQRSPEQISLRLVGAYRSVHVLRRRALCVRRGSCRNDVRVAEFPPWRCQELPSKFRAPRPSLRRVPAGKSTWVGSPVTTMREASPSRVKNIFI